MRLKFFSPLILLLGCSAQQPVDSVQILYAIGQSYTALAQSAISYINSPAATPKQIETIQKLAKATDGALDAAITTLGNCPYDKTTGKFDQACASRTTVSSAVTTAQSALNALEAELVADGVKVNK
ncbi:hypothetical protein KGP36_08295 [Patescibacteria group bacterium]|nr:hypothetical protein [Patescibacteria group bacterium]